MKILVIAAIGICLAAAGSRPAAAQYGGFWPLLVSPLGGTPVDAVPTPFSNGGSCVRMCVYDTAPCDPDYWKVADRRCNFNKRGGNF